MYKLTNEKAHFQIFCVISVSTFVSVKQANQNEQLFHLTDAWLIVLDDPKAKATEF